LCAADVHAVSSARFSSNSVFSWLLNFGLFIFIRCCEAGRQLYQPIGVHASAGRGWYRDRRGRFIGWTAYENLNHTGAKWTVDTIISVGCSSFPSSECSVTITAWTTSQ